MSTDRFVIKGLDSLRKYHKPGELFGRLTSRQETYDLRSITKTKIIIVLSEEEELGWDKKQAISFANPEQVNVRHQIKILSSESSQITILWWKQIRVITPGSDLRVRSNWAIHAWEELSSL